MADAFFCIATDFAPLFIGVGEKAHNVMDHGFRSCMRRIAPSGTRAGRAANTYLSGGSAALSTSIGNLSSHRTGPLEHIVLSDSGLSHWSL